MPGSRNSSIARVLVTGGAGFVGSNLVRALLEEGSEVRVLDDLSAGVPQNLHGLSVDVRRGSITDPDAVRRAARGIDGVVHLAALSGVAPSVAHPDHDFAVNVQGTFNVLDAARRADVSRVVFASSGAVLAGAEPPLSEAQPPRPLSPYGASKLYGEAALEAFQEAYGFSGVSLRFSNVYGPWCEHKRSVVAEFLRRAIAKRPIVIYGNGRQTRDFLHVDDVCRAVRVALRSPTRGVFHLGTGVETSINRLASLVQRVSGVRLTVERRPARSGEAGRNFSDITLARKVLGFEPRVALAEGLATTHAWLAERSGRGRGA